MSINNSARALPGIELIATMTGSPVQIGVFLHPPVHVIFDNLSNVAVVVSINGVQWKTFGAGTAVALDMRANHGLAENYAFSAGDVITGDGASGEFSVAYTYARE